MATWIVSNSFNRWTQLSEIITVIRHELIINELIKSSYILRFKWVSLVAMRSGAKVMVISPCHCSWVLALWLKGRWPCIPNVLSHLYCFCNLFGLVSWNMKVIVIKRLYFIFEHHTLLYINIVEYYTNNMFRNHIFFQSCCNYWRLCCDFFQSGQMFIL